MNKRMAMIGVVVLGLLAVAASVLARELPNLALGRATAVYEVPADGMALPTMQAGDD